MKIHVAPSVGIPLPSTDTAQVPRLPPLNKAELKQALVAVAFKLIARWGVEYLAKHPPTPRSAQVFEFEDWLWSMAPKEAEIRAEPLPPVQPTPAAPPPVSSPEPLAPPDVLAAASLLEISLDMSPSEIRAAMRTKLAASHAHPDHGGDGEDARNLIGARNLLIQWAKDQGDE